MNRSAVRRAITAAAAVTTAVVATLGGLAYPAQASTITDLSAQSQVKIVKTSGIYGGGAALVLDLEFKCAPGALEAWVNIRVTQVAGPFGTVSGEGSVPVTCSGVTETLPVAIAGYAIFGPGVAFASADLQVCTGFECASTKTAREITLVPGTREVRSYHSRDLTYRLPQLGEIQADGAGAVVLVPYTCAAGLYGAFDAILAQASPEGFNNTSNDYADLRCTATSRAGILAFHANGSGWIAGKAFILVNGVTCEEASGECSNGATYRNIKLS
jgi:hypothetical protein